MINDTQTEIVFSSTIVKLAPDGTTELLSDRLLPGESTVPTGRHADPQS